MTVGGVTAGTGAVRARRLAPPLAAVSGALAAAYASALVVLLPSQVAAVGDDKVRDLALVTTVSFALTVLSQPLLGAVSDRTAVRTGRRSGWMLGCAVVALVALAGLAGSPTVLALCVAWSVAQFALNGVDVGAAAAVPDRVGRRVRGRVFGVVGVGAVVGGALGVVGGERFTDRPAVAYLGVGLAVVGAVVWFALAADRVPATRVVGLERPRLDVRAWGRDLLAQPEYGRAFASRLLFVLAYHLVYTFQLYALTDHVGLATGRAEAVLVLLTVTSLVMILVGALAGGWWGDRTGRRRDVMVAACALLAGALLVPAAVPTVAGMAVFAVLKGLAFGLYTASGTALVTEVVPHGGATSGRDLGVYNVATNVPQTLAPALAGAIVAAAGGYVALFGTAAVVAVGALWVTTMLRRRAPVPEEAPAPG